MHQLQGPEGTYRGSHPHVPVPDNTYGGGGYNGRGGGGGGGGGGAAEPMDDEDWSSSTSSRTIPFGGVGGDGEGITAKCLEIMIPICP